MKVLVTGGKGYVGSKLVKKLEEQGNEVDTFDAVDSEYLSNVRKNIVEDYDVVYHLAALAEISYTDKHPQETYDVNIDGLNKLCSACAEKPAGEAIRRHPAAFFWTFRPGGERA